MKVTILTIGSRGDVQPYTAIALGLMARNHDVVLAAPDRFRWLAEELGIPMRSLHREPLRAFTSVSWTDALRRPAAVHRELRTKLFEALEEWDAAVADADLVVAHPQVFVAPVLARRHGAEVAFASTLPVSCPTREFPCCYLLGRSLGPVVNRLSYAVIPWALAPARRWAREWCVQRGVTDLPRRRWDLFHPDETPIPHLHGHSPVVLPRPEDWPDAWEVTGYWRTNRPGDWDPDPSLAEFLDAGSPPVYIGFGSMVYRGDRPRLTRELVRPLLERGERAVLVRGWALDDGDLRNDPDVHFIDAYEGPYHSWLFARVKAVVHHGGPGTFGAALHAGRPQVCLPFAMDQPFWAHRARDLGVAPRPLPVRSWSASEWASRVEEFLGDDRLAERAGDLSAKLRDEDGVRVAVDALERVVRDRTPSVVT